MILEPGAELPDSRRQFAEMADPGVAPVVHRFVGVFVGAAMIMAGLAWKLLAQRKAPARAVDANVVEGEYRVVRKPALPTH